jgi:mRNA-degrading endonuclease HigB of HigAB toxin-antitoxin module
MKVISGKIIHSLIEKNPECEKQLTSWLKLARTAKWASESDIEEDWPGVDFLAKNEVLFRMKAEDGTRLRLLAEVNYSFGFVWVKSMGPPENYKDMQL